MSVHADTQEPATVVRAWLFKLRQRGRLSHAIMRLLALSALIVLVLGSLVVVLCTEPYPSLFIGLAFLAAALYGARRLWQGVANWVDTSRCADQSAPRAKRTQGVRARRLLAEVSA